MSEWLLRERVLDATCFLAGRIGRAFGYRVQDPFFIIGTGRCGTTLLVKILKTHPGLSAFPGEANELWHPKLEPFMAKRRELAHGDPINPIAPLPDLGLALAATGQYAEAIRAFDESIRLSRQHDISELRRRRSRTRRPAPPGPARPRCPRGGAPAAPGSRAAGCAPARSW